MSNSIYQAFGNVRISEDNLVIEVMNSTGVEVEGSSNLVILDGDRAHCVVTGGGNTVIGSGTSGSWVDIPRGGGAGNTVSLGNAGSVSDETFDGGNTITVGDHGAVFGSKNDTIYAGKGSSIVFRDGDVINADNSSVRAIIDCLPSVVVGVSEYGDQIDVEVSVNGDGNQIGVEGGTLVLNGSNNTITASAERARQNGLAAKETITTSTGSVVADVNGMVLTGTASAANITLTGGVATVDLGNGNVVKLSGISSGAIVQYIDASGAKIVSTLKDANVENIGGTLFDVSGDATVGQDNAFFDVLNSDTEVNVAGSGNTVMLDANGDNIKVAGNGNTILGSESEHITVTGSDNFFSLGDQAEFYLGGNGNTMFGADHSRGEVWGSNNVLSLGDDAFCTVEGDGNVITVGDNAIMYTEDAHVTITAGAHAVFNVYAGGTVNADNAVDIFDVGGDLSVNGNSNLIDFEGDKLNLSGSNNSISMSALDIGDMTPRGTGHPQTITTDTGSFSDLGNEIVITGSIKVTSVTWGSGGVATIDLGDGNIVTLSGVSSGTSVKYIDSSGATSVATLTDPSLLHVSGTLYNVKSDIYAAQSKSILDVFSGASLYLSGSSNQVILESGSHGGYVFGDKNTIVGTKVSGATESITGNGNVAQFGANNTIFNFGNGNTITVGANSTVFDTFGNTWSIGGASSTTINATQGGARIAVFGQGETVNANNATINEDWLYTSYSSSIKGNGNLIDVRHDYRALPNTALSLNGSNNTIHLDSANGDMVKTTTGSLVAKSNELVLTGTADVNSISLVNGTVTMSLGSGNVVTFGGVLSGANVEYIDASGKATWSVLQDSAAGVPATRSLGATSGTQADAQVNQLVAAMASYSAGSGGVGASAQMSPNANVQPLAASAVLH
jgi:hypothetical protein